MKFRPENIAKLLILLFAIAIVFVLNGCVTYQKCKEKFANNFSDTTTVIKTDTVKIPKDSLVVLFTNDTIPFYWEESQGRAKLKINRTAKETKIEASCDSLIKIVTLKAKCPPVVNNWGVSPNWRTGFYVLSGAFILALICASIFYFNTRK